MHYAFAQLCLPIVTNGETSTQCYGITFDRGHISHEFEKLRFKNSAQPDFKLAAMSAHVLNDEIDYNPCRALPNCKLATPELCCLHGMHMPKSQLIHLRFFKGKLRVRVGNNKVSNVTVTPLGLGGAWFSECAQPWSLTFGSHWTLGSTAKKRTQMIINKARVRVF